MKTCLTAINSKYIHENLAVHSLYAYARSKGVDSFIEEFTINQTHEYVLQKLYAVGAQFYAFSVYIWNISFVLRIAEDLSRVRPDADIWLGGPEVSYNAQSLMSKYRFISGIMRGEGEETFTELIKAYDTSENCHALKTEVLAMLSNVEGITYRDETGSIITNPDRHPMDPDDLVFPYEGMEFDPTRIYYYESLRGCPFGCSYCLSSIDKRVRYRSTELVKKEISYFLEKGIRQVKFVDRTFNCDRKRAYELLSFIKDNDNGITNFHFEIGADLLCEEDIVLLAGLRPGQVQLEIGVQSTNEETLEAIHRKTDLKKLAFNVKAMLKAHNIHIHLDLIAGLPYEDINSFRKSFNDVCGLRPLQLQLGFLKVLKGTKMESVVRECDGYGCSDYPPYEVLYTPWITYAELAILKGIAEMVEIFHNSRQFENTIERLSKEFNDFFEMYYRLSLFYVGRHYDEVRHARVRLYEIMLEFIEDCGFNRDEYVPLLLRDAYAREKLKHFPEWAKGYEHTVSFDYDKRDPLTNNAMPYLN